MPINKIKFLTSVLIFFSIALLSSIFFYHKKYSIKTQTDLKLLFAIDIIRHGDRTPIHHIPVFSNYWQTQEKGILTKKGEDEAFKLGQELGSYYINQKNFLPREFDQQIITFRSSDTQRTKKTAEKIIQGMYPEKKDLKVQTFIKTQDPLLPLTFSLGNITKSFYENTNQSTSEVEETIHTLNQILGTTFTIQDIGRIADNIKVNEYHNIKKPSNIPTDLYTKIKAIGKMIRLHAFKFPKTSCAAGLPLVNNISTLMETSATTQKPQYVLYVTHDAMIMGVLNILANKSIDPEYLARIQIEVLQDISKNIYVKMTYNNTIVKLCGTNLCDIHTFKSHINKAIHSCGNIYQIES